MDFTWSNRVTKMVAKDTLFSYKYVYVRTFVLGGGGEHLSISEVTVIISNRSCFWKVYANEKI